MISFKAGDHVIVYPGGLPGIIKEINLSSSYPIKVNHRDGYHEGSYTLEGRRYKNSRYQHTHYIELAVKSKSPERPKTNNYWTVVRANSAFIQLSHPNAGTDIIPIHAIKEFTKIGDTTLELLTDKYCYEMNMTIEELSSILFNKSQTNSI